MTEKCEAAIFQLHRPIKTSTASAARILEITQDGEVPIGPTLDEGTLEYITYTTRSEGTSRLLGQVSSYNKNTYKGRVYVPIVGRPIPFELSESTRDQASLDVIADSLSLNIKSDGRFGQMSFEAYELVSRTGQLKRYLIVDVES